MSHEDFNQELNALRENLPTVVEETTGSKTAVQGYSIGLAERIVEDYAQGVSLYAISRKSEMPAYSTLLKWAKKHPEFSKMLRAVREARALHFEDAAIAAAEAAEGKDADRLKFEAYKWGAEVNDPTTYGKKVEHKGDVTTTIKFVKVNTGFGDLPPALQFPKLNPDGTIQKPEPKDVEAVVSDGKRPDDSEHDRKTDAPANAGSAPGDGLQDAPSSGVRGEPDGLPALQPEPGHPDRPGSAEST